MICDLDDWILGKIAKQLSLILKEEIKITILVSHSRDFHAKLSRLQTENDVVHFLSPWDFFNVAKTIYLPCVVMLWHMVDWSEFQKHSQRIDTLCVGSKQWLQLSQSYVSQELPVMRVHYGLDTNFFQKRTLAKQSFIEEFKLNKEVLVFGFAGSAWSNESNRKGLDRLWNCLIKLKTEQNIPFVLRIAGRHWSSDIVPVELQAYTKISLDIPNELLPEFYSSLDYYICTSRCEGVPYPVLEAMSCECVVISTAVGVVPEILVNGENGFLLHEDNLEKNFIKIISNTAKNLDFRSKCGFLARNTVVNKFSWESAVNPLEYQNVYTRAIQFYRSRTIFQQTSYILNALIIPHLSLLSRIMHLLRYSLKLRSKLARFFPYIPK
jgi:glycosyltransferase involved in cell wall biosynthesis